MSKLKAYQAYYRDDDWITYVHAETPSKAKARFALVDPLLEYDRSRWTDIRLKRKPDWDDKPFTRGDDYNNLFAPYTYDENGYGVFPVDMDVDCNCPLCKPRSS